MKVPLSRPAVSDAPAPSESRPPPPSLRSIRATLIRFAPGLLASIGVGTAASFIARGTPSLSPLIWAILIGAVTANAVRLPGWLQPGVTFSAKQVLRLAVGLLGLRLGLPHLLAVGPVGLAVTVLAVVATLLFSIWVGRRLGLSRPLSTILASGTAICGAAAIVAVAGVIDAKEEDTAVGVGAVTLYGTAVMLLYPLIATLSGMSPELFGLWAGASIHEVAQVVAAAFSFDAAGGTTAAVEVATVVKLGRVLMLAPVAVVLSVLTRRQPTSKRGAGVSAVPWFVALFIGAVAVRSTEWVPGAVIDRLVQFDNLLLAIAMAGLGLDLRWARVKAAGLKPLYATFAATAFIGVLTLGFVKVFA